MKKENREKMNKNSGSTMVETLVSFVVLFIVLAALYGIVSFSSELYMKSVDTTRLHQKFYQELYKFPSGKATGESTVNYDTSLLEEPKDYKPGYAGEGENSDDYASLSLVLDTSKTKAANYNNKSSISNTYINLSKIGVTSFVAVDQLDKNGKSKELILPKALHFWFSKPEGD